MAKPEKQERPDPKNQAELFIAEWQEKFSIAISQAREAMDTTNTPAWTANYQAQIKLHRQEIATNVKAIDALTEYIGNRGNSEDDEKGIKEAVKNLADERIRFQAWRYRAVSPYELSAQNASSLRKETIQAARRAEEESSLVNHGLAAEVAALVDGWPVAVWDDERGTATVQENTK